MEGFGQTASALLLGGAHDLGSMRIVRGLGNDFQLQTGASRLNIVLPRSKANSTMAALASAAARSSVLSFSMDSTTITPEHDTPETLKTYVEKFRVGPGWQFRAGRTEEITRLRKKLGL